ncbi:MAG: hypothetical protein WCJ63_07350 [Actinomycetes bacterium]
MKVITTLIAGLALLAVPAVSSAALVQQSDVKIVPTSGAKPKVKSYVKLDAYLSTRDAASTRGTGKTNPVGFVSMDFPAGSTINKAAGPVCNQSEYSTPSFLAANCASSVIGTGWALLNGGVATAREQITGAATACNVDDATQYSRTYATGPQRATGPSCLPIGDVWVKVTAYQGGILKNQWWCYGPKGAPKPGAACNNKQSGADATGKGFAFNDTKNAKKLNGCNIIFANDNSLAQLAFGGTANQCKNRLTVIIPAMNGTGAGLGELTGGIVLTDFALKTTKANYLKVGASCPAHKFTVTTKVTYSKLKGETAAPSPVSNTNKTVTAC